MSRKPVCFSFFGSCLVSLICLSACSVCRQQKFDSVSPLDYGLRTARNGEERYEVLYQTHREAIRLGRKVDYSGIKKIDLVIPRGAKSIPLTDKTEFGGVRITVENNSKTLFLFEYTREMRPITVKARDVDNQNYTSPYLGKGLYLLSIKDDRLWVANREGYSYGATRRDIVLIEDGKGKDGPCSPYSSASSSPSYVYRAVTNEEKSFANITFVRRPGSTQLTKLVRFTNENNIRIENVSITTPVDTLIGDQVIHIENCSNIQLIDITIDGTYSTKEQYGYGISLNNVWNVTCKNIYAKTSWGVFGTNNVHKAHLVNCDINRFDIHCYGKDVLCEDCSFTGTGGIYSSVFGTIEYRRCTFNDASPYFNRADYNAYVHFNLVLKDCIVNAPKTRPYLFNLRTWSDKINERAELKTKCWPDVTIENMTVNLPEGIDTFELFRVPKSFANKRPAAGLSEISIKGLVFNYPPNAKKMIAFKLSSSELQLVNRLNCTLEGIELRPGGERILTRSVNDQPSSDRIIVNMKSSKRDNVRIINSKNND